MTFIFTSNVPAHLVWRGEDLAPLDRRLTNDRYIEFNKIQGRVTRHGVDVGNTPAAAQATSTPESPELLEIIDDFPPTRQESPVYLEDYINEHM